MYKRLIPAVALLAYGALLIKIMVLKDMPMVRVGHIMLNFGGEAVGRGNFVPFATIVPYLMGHKGLVIAGINLVGNIILLVPLGFLVPLIYPSITWKKSLALAAASGLVIETMQVLLRVGIFDIDDVILNALGFMIGYWIFLVLAKLVRSKIGMLVVGTTIVVMSVAAVYGYQKFPLSLEAAPSGNQSGSLGNGGGGGSQGEDLCGGTGGNGEIVSIASDSFTMDRGSDGTQIVHLAAQAEINTPAGRGSISDLKMGDRVTLVGGPNQDGSFTADAIFVCGDAVGVAPSGTPVFEWSYKESSRDDIPYSAILLTARYPNGQVKKKDIDTIAGGCNEYEPADADVYRNSAMIICYYAGLGHYYKVVEANGEYLVRRKVFEEASPEYTPPPEEFETIARF